MGRARFNGLLASTRQPCEQGPHRLRCLDGSDRDNSEENQDHQDENDRRRPARVVLRRAPQGYRSCEKQQPQERWGPGAQGDKLYQVSLKKTS